MKIKLIALGIILSFIILSMPLGLTTQVYASDGEQQPTQEQPVISPEFEKYLSSLDPTDNITVIVSLKEDLNVQEEIRAIWEGQPDDEWHRISESLKQRYRKLSAAIGPFEQQLREGDPAAIERYRQLVVEYGLTEDNLKADNERLQELRVAKSEQVDSILEQAYSNMQEQAKKTIEAIPDTKVRPLTYSPNCLSVTTKVGNIKAIAAVSNVTGIFENARSVPDIVPYAPTLISPPKDMCGYPVEHPSFSWSPNSTKYEFVLAQDPSMTTIIKDSEVPESSYVYDSTLEYSTTYYWRVRSLEPASSDWSDTFSFQTEVAPAPPFQPISPIAIITLSLIVAAAAAGLITWLLISKEH